MSMKLSPSELIYSLIAFFVLMMLADFSSDTTFTYFVNNYWVYSTVSAILIGGYILYYINKNIDKYGFIFFGLMLLIILTCTFFVIPRFFHYSGIISVKKVALKSIISDKHVSRSTMRNPYIVDIKIYVKNNLNLLKYSEIIINIKSKYYKKLKINDKVKTIVTLSKVGYDLEGIEKGELKIEKNDIYSKF